VIRNKEIHHNQYW